MFITFKASDGTIFCINIKIGFIKECLPIQPNNAVKNKSFSQGLFSKNGSLKFTKRAEAEANKLNEANTRIAELPKAAAKDFYAGGVMPETAK
ncbi:hypothetical protein IKJ53_00680 [bacterium]|nr:hypothetical protein [bacterium]